MRKYIYEPRAEYQIMTHSCKLQRSLQSSMRPVFTPLPFLKSTLVRFDMGRAMEPTHMGMPGRS